MDLLSIATEVSVADYQQLIVDSHNYYEQSFNKLLTVMGIIVAISAIIVGVISNFTFKRSVEKEVASQIGLLRKELEESIVQEGANSRRLAVFQFEGFAAHLQGSLALKQGEKQLAFRYLTEAFANHLYSGDRNALRLLPTLNELLVKLNRDEMLGLWHPNGSDYKTYIAILQHHMLETKTFVYEGNELIQTIEKKARELNLE